MVRQNVLQTLGHVCWYKVFVGRLILLKLLEMKIKNNENFLFVFGDHILGKTHI